MNNSTASIRHSHVMSDLRACSLLTLCTLGTAAHAEHLTAHATGAGQPDPLTTVVAYEDLNVDTTAGAKALYSRLRAAAKEVCAPLEGRHLRRSLWQGCFDNAVTAAVVQVNKTRVTALHNQADPRKRKPLAPTSASNNRL
jgi:UrcA family protein